MTESEKPQQPEVFRAQDDDKKDDTEGHSRYMFQGDGENPAPGQQDDTEQDGAPGVYR